MFEKVGNCSAQKRQKVDPGVKQISSHVKATPANAAAVRVQCVSKDVLQHGQPLAVLQEVDLYAAPGEFISIIGPSGCGKSTLLNILAGLDSPSSGAVYLHGRRTEQRLGQVGYMQQKDLLLPWRTILDNVILGLELRRVPRRVARGRATALLEQFGLKGFEHAYPYALSGGMRQRAAFLRTFLPEHEVFLLDEPFGALDALTRTQLHAWLLGLWEALYKTIVLVTHDVDEAIFLADRVYVMTARPGRVTLIQPIQLPRPRHQEIITTVAFTTLKAKLLAALRQEPLAGPQEGGP
jgi:ABC-type nitrate/sulfonate/bicarbonate transport system ATPase subunit